MNTKTCVVTDSHSSITQEEAVRLGITVIPAPFFVDGKLFYEGVTLSRADFFAKQDAGAEIHTSQPSVTEVTGTWDSALSVYDEVLYIPMSSGLSGSCNTAKMLSEDEQYKGRVFVVDNGRISTPLHCSILDALKLIEAGKSAAEIKELLERYREDQVVYIAIDDISHLKKGGRLTSRAQKVAGILNIKPIVIIDSGPIELYSKPRGMKRAKLEMFEAIKKALPEYGNCYLMTATSADEEENEAFINEVKEAFPGMEVMSDYLSLGTCCHVGKGCLGVGICRKIEA